MLGRPHCQRVTVAHKRHAEEQRFVDEPFQPTFVRQAGMTQAQLVVPLRRRINEALEPELLHESVQLSEGCRSLVHIHEVSFHPPLGEEAECFTRIGILFHSKDLNFHGCDLTVIKREVREHHQLTHIPQGRSLHVSSKYRSEYIYRPAWWVPGAHAQTLWGKFFRRRRPLPIRAEHWETPDRDFIEVHRLAGPAGAPRLFFLHGLEGTIRSHYVAGFFEQAKDRGWAADLLIFRGCGAEQNRAPRFYHSGETTDLAFALERILREIPEVPIVLAGVSLGGNVLLKFLGEQGTNISDRVRGAATVSVPYDLERSARFISSGLSRIYDRHFLRTLRAKAVAKLDRFPGLFDRGRLESAGSIFEFDDAVTAPVHGFPDAHDYYAKSSSLGWLPKVRIPTFLLSAADDPFLPSEVLSEVRDAVRHNPNLTAEFTGRGGHVGFVAGRLPWRPLYYAEWRACEFLTAALARDGRGSSFPRSAA